LGSSPLYQTGFSKKSEARADARAAGNLLYDGIHTYTYDAENRIVSVDSGSGGTYVYNADGKRVGKVVGANVTYFIYGSDGQVVAERDAGNNWIHTYAHFGGQLLAFYNGTSTAFYHHDHLGSSRLITLYSAGSYSIADNMDYLPFGEQATGGTASTHKFTGKERDSESGLDNFGARYLNSTIGRFMTPDEPLLDQRATAPQSWNLYSYVRNNPIVFRDLDGATCTQDSQGNFHGDTCDKDTETGKKPQEVTVNEQTDKNERLKGWFKGFGNMLAPWLNRNQYCPGCGFLTPTFYPANYQQAKGMRDFDIDMQFVGFAAPMEIVGEFSLYRDITIPGSIPNIETDVTVSQFGSTLESAGYTKSVSANGTATIYSKGDLTYSVYPKATTTGGPTAQVKLNGEVIGKIRLK